MVRRDEIFEGLLDYRRSQVSCKNMRAQGNTESMNPLKNKQWIEHIDRQIAERKNNV